MPLSKQAAVSLIKGLHGSNRDYLVKTFNLNEEEAEFLLSRWKIYLTKNPDVLKQSPLHCLDSFVHGYLAHVEFTRNRPNIFPGHQPCRRA
jgi:hypothetical protein